MAIYLSLSGFQWCTCGKHVTGQTYPFAYGGGGRAQNVNIIRGAANKLLKLQRTGYLQTACPLRRRERTESRPATTASWAEVAAREPISNTTTILDWATDMSAPENMEAETLQVTDSAPRLRRTR